MKKFVYLRPLLPNTPSTFKNQAEKGGIFPLVGCMYVCVYVYMCVCVCVCVCMMCIIIIRGLLSRWGSVSIFGFAFSAFLVCQWGGREKLSARLSLLGDGKKLVLPIFA